MSDTGKFTVLLVFNTDKEARNYVVFEKDRYELTSYEIVDIASLERGADSFQNYAISGYDEILFINDTYFNGNYVEYCRLRKRFINTLKHYNLIKNETDIIG
jgi:hypothetical protein